MVVPGRVGTPQRGTGTPTSAAPRTGTPHPLSAAPLSAGGDRGIKREREEGHGPGANGAGVPPQNGQMPMQNGTTQNVAPRAPVPVIAAARAGIPGARPRPVKKQRVVRLARTTFPTLILFCFHFTQDMQGQSRDVSAVQQQPTPQGV